MNFPIEILNHILSFRPTHPTAKIINNINRIMFHQYDVQHVLNTKGFGFIQNYRQSAKCDILEQNLKEEAYKNKTEYTPDPLWKILKDELVCKQMIESRIIRETLINENKSTEDIDNLLDKLLLRPMECRTCPRVSQSVDKIGCVFTTWREKQIDGTYTDITTPDDLQMRCSHCKCVYRCKCGSVIKDRDALVKAHFKTKKHQEFMKTENW
jgi:hypothetical protein